MIEFLKRFLRKKKTTTYSNHLVYTVNHLPNYEIIESKSNSSTLVLQDLGPWPKYPTITAAADKVVEDLLTRGIVLTDRRILYYDSMGFVTEIVLTDGKYSRINYSPITDLEGKKTSYVTKKEAPPHVYRAESEENLLKIVRGMIPIHAEGKLVGFKAP